MRVPLLNFEGGPGVLLLNFEESTGVPLLNLRGSQGLGSRGPSPTFTPCPKRSVSKKLLAFSFKILRFAEYQQLTKSCLGKSSMK